MTPVVLTPMRLEAAALSGALDGTTVLRTGLGRRCLNRIVPQQVTAAVVAGVAGALAGGVEPGDVVVASEVRDDAGGVVPVPSAPLLAGALRRAGVSVHVGPVLGGSRLVTGAQRRRLAERGLLAADMESARLAGALRGRPLAVVRVVVDTPRRPLFAPGTVVRGARALRTLRSTGPVLRDWAAATGRHEVLLAAPHACADDVCHATTHRQAAVLEMARRCDVVLVLGLASCAAAQRLAEFAARQGPPSHLVGDVEDVDLRWLAAARRVGVAACACAPPDLVDGLVAALAGLGPVTQQEIATRTEDVVVTVPKDVS